MRSKILALSKNEEFKSLLKKKSQQCEMLRKSVLILNLQWTCKWELINEIIPKNKIFGDAAISDKHSNFFVNKKNATYGQMKKLIDYVRSEIEKETGIKLDLEIEIIG